MRRWVLIFTALPLLAKTPEWDQANLLYKESKFTQAAAVLEKAPKSDPDNLVLLGQTYMALKRFGDAVDTFERATKIQPASSQVQLWLGRAWGRLAESNKLLGFGRARKAKDALEKAVALDPKNGEALDDLFEYYFEAPGVVGGGLDKAERVAKQIASIDPAKGERLLSRVEERKK